jgi:hypothetical protein
MSKRRRGARSKRQNPEQSKTNQCIVCKEFFSDEDFDHGINECYGCYYESTDEE